MLIETELDTSAVSEVALSAFSQNEKDAASDFIAHHGIKGQKWGVRRYQNSDGSLTEAGRKHYSKGIAGAIKRKRENALLRDTMAISSNKKKRDKAFDEWTKDFDDAEKAENKYSKLSSAEDKAVSKAERYSRSKDKNDDVEKDLWSDAAKKGNDAEKYWDDVVEKAQSKSDSSWKKVEDLDNESKKLNETYKKKADKYIKKYGEVEYDKLPKNGTEVTEQAIDDYIRAMSGELTKSQFNRKYKGTGFAVHDFITSENDYLAHHGIKGQKWGVRRYQNSDGSLTAEGRKRYGVGPAIKNASSAAGRAIGKAIRKATGRQTDAELDAELAKARKVHERKMKVDEINDLTGKKKKLSKMTDQEVDQYINRLSKERTVRQAENDLKRMNRSDFSNFMHDLKTKSYEGIAEGAKRGISDYTSARIKQIGGHRMDMKDRKWNEKHETDHLTELDKATRAQAISKMKYETAKANKDRRDLFSKTPSLKDQADDNKNRLNATRDDLERRALEGDSGAAESLRRVAEAKKGKGKEESPTPAPATPSITQKGLSGVSKSDSGYRDVRNRPATEKVVSSIEDKPKKKKKKK